MADKIALLLEAEKRGILPPEKVALLAEARKRGLVPGGQAKAPADFSGVTAKVDTTANSVFDRAAAGGRGFMDAHKQFTSAVGHHAMNPLHGLAQATQHGVQALTNAAIDAPQQSLSGLVTGDAPKAQTLPQRFRQYVNETVASDDEAMRQREAEYQARTPDSLASYAGATAGEVIPFAVGAPAKLLQAAGTTARGLLSKAPQLVQRIGSGATQGGLLGLTQPVLDEDYSEGKTAQVGIGAGTGGLLPVVANAARGVTNLARPIFRPQAVADENVARLYGSDAATLAKLENARAYVPGERVTAAQAAPSPRAVMVEKALRNRPDMKEQFTAQDLANNDLRVGVLRRMAGTDEAFDEAVKTRRETARAFADERLQPGPENMRFTRAAQSIQGFLDSNPRMSSADFDMVNEARLIAGRVNRGTLDEADAVKQLKAIEPASKAAKGAIEQALVAVNRNMVSPKAIERTLANLSMSGNSTIRSAAKEHLSLIREHAERNGGRVPAYALDDIRQNIGVMLSKHAPNGAVGSQEGAKYGPVAAQITRTLDRAIPGYRDHLAAYRSNSVPINTMESARGILGPLDTRGVSAGGTSGLSLSQLNTGLRKVDKQRFGLAPEARQQLEGVRQSLRRASASDSLRSPGSDTDYNLQARGWLAGSLLGKDFTGPSNATQGLLPMIGAAVGGGSGGGWLGAAAGAGLGVGVKAAADKINQRIVTRVASGAMDSQEAARMIRRHLAANETDANALLRAYPEWAALIGREPLMLTAQ